ncbi:MAG TPA: hypothetical protein DIU00_23345 [Phycisphaerales bacterium]|nr:hypothetical protein [Phycisphaerales bacterium]
MFKKSVYFAVVWGLFCLVGTAGALGEKGEILFEYWDGIGGTLDILYNSDKWPYQPDTWEYRTSLEGETDWADTYSTRVRGFLYPPDTGTYFFWIASDDGSELWLSKGEDPGSATRIANVAEWTVPQEWTKFPSQQSGAIHLEDSNRYYIEARHVEGDGGDHLAVAWAGPGIGSDPVVILGTYLSPLIRLKSIFPNPADGAIDVKPTNRILRWSPGTDHTAGYFDVYLGTDPDNLLLVADNKPFASKLYVHAAGFEPGQIYYWRVDAVETDKTTICTGDLWSFSVLPMIANTPNPADWARNKLTDVELNWRAGANGDFHHVYFGTDKDTVDNADENSPEYKGRTVGTTTTFDPGELQRGTTYYWRVDEAKATGAKWKGFVWTFSTLPILTIHDPDLLGWWKLDEGSGNSVIDWSGHENHGEILYLNGGLGDDGNVWVDDPDKGMVLTFNGNDQTGAVVKAGKIPAIGATDNFTWAFWARQEGDGTGEFETILGNRDVGVDYPRFIMFTPTKFEYFVNTGEYTVNHGAVGGLDYPDLLDGVWTHHAITKDGTTLTYYRNGIETRVAITLLEQGENALYIGGDLVSGRWSGSIYNVRIYKRALSVEELESAMRRDAAVAWDPTPTHRRVVDIEGISRLTWKPGDNAIEHDVYLGTDAHLVAQATPEDTTGLYRSRQSGIDYTTDDLQMGQTYYWRIDEINNDGSVSEGYVWCFTVAAYLIVDDFESYNDIDPPDPESHTIFGSWLDGYLTPTTNGALVGYDPAQPPSQPSYMEHTIVYDGSQSLPLYYDNNSARYSEATLTLDYLTNWTLHDVTTLGIAVHGRVSSDDPAIGNNPEKIYVVVEDTTGKTGIAHHPDNPDATTFAEWTEWLIDLAEIAAQGVDLSHVKTLTIRIGDKSTPGTGLIYIDGIRLYPDLLVGLN